MKSLPIYLTLCAIFNLVKTEYLFEEGKVSFREYKHGKRVQNRVALKRVQFIDQHYYPKTIDIKVHTRKIPDLHEGAVKSLPLLKIIRMPKCGIEKISPRAFQNLPKLQELHLQDNHVQIIEDEIFNYLPIKKLFLQRNRIKTIRSGAFDNMPNLVHIVLNKNHLTHWNPDWFRNTPNLSHLSFRRNAITELPPKAFANIKSSHKVNGEELVDTKIFLSKNNISTVDPNAFSDLDALLEIWLDRNRIAVLDKDVFSHMSELEAVHLEKNLLEEIDRSAFENLRRMSVLDVSRNRIACLPFEVVALADVVVVEGDSVDCQCVENLRERLREDGRENKINDECEGDEELD